MFKVFMAVLKQSSQMSENSMAHKKIQIWWNVMLNPSQNILSSHCDSNVNRKFTYFSEFNRKFELRNYSRVDLTGKYITDPHLSWQTLHIKDT